MSHPLNLTDDDLDFLKPDIDFGHASLVQTNEDKNQAELVRLARLSVLLDKYNEASKESGIHKWFVPGTPFGIENCPKHRAFFDAGAQYNERLFLAANRIGKSISGAFEASCHATGVYPSWWRGKRFDKPTKGWVVGSTARSTRDVVQKELIGPLGAWGTGMIPKEKLGQWFALSGVPQGIDIIQVRHVSGGWSTIGFKNYEQKLDAFYGTDMDWVWMDEECPQETYNECLLRTMTTDGIIYVTFTPLKGLTPMVVKFSEQADYLAGAERLIGLSNPNEDEDDEGGDDARFKDIVTHKAIIQAGWDDAPWLTEDKKEQMLADTPPHLREARRSGKPSMGSGNVYPIAYENLLVKPFPIPDYYKRLFALDVGWNVTAAVWAAIDPQTDTIYIYDEYYGKEALPSTNAAAIRARGAWIPGVIDPASRGRSPSDGTQLLRSYRDLGLNLLPANNEVDAGIQNLWQRMSTGNFKIFNTLQHWPREFALYRRDLKGRIMKENDHLMDATRYIQNNLIRAKSTDQLRKTPVINSVRKYNV